MMNFNKKFSSITIRDPVNNRTDVPGPLGGNNHTHHLVYKIFETVKWLDTPQPPMHCSRRKFDQLRINNRDSHFISIPLHDFQKGDVYFSYSQLDPVGSAGHLGSADVFKIGARLQMRRNVQRRIQKLFHKDDTSTDWSQVWVITETVDRLELKRKESEERRLARERYFIGPVE